MILTTASVMIAATACGGSSPTKAQGSASVCADALNAADAGFNDLGANVRLVQRALDQAFAGNLGAAHSTLNEVQPADPSTYKRLEAECRAAVKR